MALSRGYTFGATETVTNAKLHALVDDGSVSGIVNADIAADADIDGSKIDIDTTGNVLITGTQTITGAKTFSATTAMAGVSATGLTVNGDGNVTGALTVGSIVMPDVSLTTGVTGTLPVANGGTGQTTAQLAINALTAVSAATNEHVFTKDTSTGNAVFKALPTPSKCLFAGRITQGANTHYALNQETGSTSDTILFRSYMPIAGTFKNLYGCSPNGDGISAGLTVYKNGSATALTVIAMPSDARLDSTHSFTVVAGDYVQIYRNYNADYSYTLEFDPS